MSFGSGRLFFLGRMKKNILAFGIFIVAFVILFISIFDSSSITYSFANTPPQPFSESKESKINYILPYAGRVMPDSPLWGLKALRDKVWFGITTSPLRRAQLALLFADKRLVMAEAMFKKGEPEVAMLTYLKGERYLPIAFEQEKIARSRGLNTDAFLQRLALASLKHKEVSEYLVEIAPENVKPMIISTEVYAENTYEDAKNALISRGLTPPNNPFIGD